MRKPGGYAVIVEPGRATREADTFTCKHCQRVVHVPAKADPAALGGVCKLCMGLICPRCVGRGCSPWQQTMERQERREALVRAARGA